MGKHRLSLEVPDTLSACILRVQDSSSYDELLAVKCLRLLISIPGFSSSYFIEDISSGFSLNLTACDLKIQPELCGSEFNNLPDGVYVLNYSVSPNDQVYVEYNHLRITLAMIKLRALYCKIEVGCCNDPEQKKKLDAARLIGDYLTAAKALVEDCRQVKKGLDLFKEALRLLDKANCKTCN